MCKGEGANKRRERVAVPAPSLLLLLTEPSRLERLSGQAPRTARKHVLTKSTRRSEGMKQ